VKWNERDSNSNANKINENIRIGQENKLIETNKIYKNTREIDRYKQGKVVLYIIMHFFI